MRYWSIDNETVCLPMPAPVSVCDRGRKRKKRKKKKKRVETYFLVCYLLRHYFDVRDDELGLDRRKLLSFSFYLCFQQWLFVVGWLLFDSMAHRGKNLFWMGYFLSLWFFFLSVFILLPSRHWWSALLYIYSLSLSLFNVCGAAGDGV